MRLPISYLLHKIRKDICFYHQIEYDMDFTVYPPVFYIDGERFLEDTIYIANADDIDSGQKLPLGTFILYKGKLKFSPKKNMIKLNDSASFYQIHNKLQECFVRVGNWEQKLQEALYRKADFSEIVKICGEFLERPIGLMNPQFFLDAEYFPEGSTHLFDQKDGKEPGKFSAQIVNAIKSDDYYKQMELYQMPFTYSVSEFHEVFYCANLLYQNTFIGRLIMREGDMEVRPWNTYFLERIRYFILPDYVHFWENGHPQEKYHDLLITLFTGKEYSQRLLEQFLKDKLWNADDYYLCFYILTSTEDIDNHTQKYFAREIESILTDAVCFVLDEQIAVLYHIGKTISDHEESSIKTDNKLLNLLRESNFRMGVSRPFRYVSNICYGYSQAIAALECGQSEYPMLWNVSFEQVVIPYILKNCCGNLPKEFICHPALFYLKELDEINGSSYLKTLKTYLECNQNIVQASKALFIHRGTMIYRMERIREMTGLSIDSLQERMYLLLSIILLDQC